MALQEKATQEDLILFEILRNPVLFGEFIYNLNKLPQEEPFEFSDYQMEMLCDFNPYISFCTARAVGKCLHKDSKILNPNTGEYKTVEQWFFDANLESILAIDSNWKQHSSTPHIEPNGIQDCIEIVAANGYTTKVTIEHPILTNNGFIPANKLKIGDYIAVAKEIPYFGNECTFTDEEIKILAHFIAKGTYKSASITTTSPEVIKDIYDYANSIKHKVRKDNTSYCISNNFHNEYYKLLDRLELRKKHSYTKFIPQEIFKLPKNKLALFLSRLFGDDGWCISTPICNEVGYATTSKELGYNIKHLLLRFGIQASLAYKTNKHKGYWTLSIKGYSSLCTFLNEIDFAVDYKHNKLLSCINNTKTTHNQADILPVPGFNKYLYPKKDTVSKKYYPAHIRYYPSRIKSHDILNKDSTFSKFESADIYWVRVKTLTLLKDQETYAIEVNKYNTHLVDDIWSHNTVSLTTLLIWALVFNLFPNDYILYTVPSKVHLEPVWQNLIRQFRSNIFLKQFLDSRSGLNSSEHTIKLLNQSLLMCRIAGQTGTGANLIGLHTPFILVDECVTGSQKIASDGKYILARELKVGDVIKSWDGNKIEFDRVLNIKKKSTDQQVLNIRHSLGNLHVGENHRIYTERGYIEAKHLKAGDLIFINNEKNRKRISTDEANEIKELILSGLTLTEIANETHRTIQSLRHIIDRNFHGIRNIKDISLTYEQKQIILGTLLGDSSSDTRYRNRANLSSNHSIKQKEYVDWLIQKLGILIRTKPRICRNGGWGTLNYAFSSLYHKEIKEISNLLYINNKKTITLDYLNQLDLLGLAVWFMDDGTFEGSLSTHCFSLKENMIIVDYFKTKWDIDCSIIEDKRKNLFYIKIKSLKHFRELIKDYIPTCMLYKIDKDYTPPEVSLSENIIVINESPRKFLSEVKILSITNLKTTPKFLYEITVEKNHNFFCNDVLVKNCGYFPYPAYQEMQPSLNTWTPGFREMVAGVPTGLRENNVLYMADMENSNFTKHRVPAERNPRITEEDKQRAVEQYGGEDSDDFIHYFKGQHGKPIFSLFDRSMFELSNYPVYKLKLDGIDMRDNVASYVTKLAAFPGLADKSYQCFMGVDLGYTEPTAIVIFYLDHFKRIKIHGRIQLTKVSYPIQIKLLDMLDSKFGLSLIGIDKGSSGISVIQQLMEGDEFIYKNYGKRIIPIDFSSQIVLGIDSNGEEIKSKTKPFSVSVLQDYSNNHKIVYSTTDLELITELERMTYSKTPSGEIIYKTLTARGGKKGEDHFTSAMLCGSLAYYLHNEFIAQKQLRKRLFHPMWLGV